MTTPFPTPTVYLPMLPEYHTDYNTTHSTNAQVLAYDGTVYLNGDGSTASTIMDKVRHVGYSNAVSGKYLYKASSPLSSTSKCAVAVLFSQPDFAANRSILSIEDASNAYLLLWVATTGEVRFETGAIGAAYRALSPWNIDNKQIYYVYGHYDGSNTQIYVNGIKGTDAGTPTAPVYNSQPVDIWRRYNGTLYGYGSLYQVMMWDNDSLTEDEILDNERFMREVYARHYV